VPTIGPIKNKNKTSSLGGGRGWVKHLWLLTVFANISVFVVLVWSASSDFRHLHREAEAKSRTVNMLVAAEMAAQLDRVRMGLKIAAAEIIDGRRQGGDETRRMASLLRQIEDELPMVEAIVVVGASGRVLYGNDLPPGGPFDLADRDYFQQARDRPGARLVISKPLIGRIKGKAVIVCAVRLERDGLFEGIVYAPITLSWFNREFAKLDVGPQGTVVLRGDASRDFDLLARHPFNGAFGETKVSDRFIATITANPAEGTYEAPAGNDDIRRIFSYRQLEGYPLITLVGIGVADLWSQWYGGALPYVAFAVAFLVLSLAGARMVMSAWAAHALALEHAATDVLTGVANRRGFNECLGREMERGMRTNRQICLIVLDIDHFKQINDRYGHAAGDEALKAFAAVCAGAIRSIDVPARIGGEEFAVLLPDTALAVAADVGERIRWQIAETPFTANGQPITMTCSLGVAQMEEADTPNAFLARADQALYEAKRGGRNRLVVRDSVRSLPGPP